MRRGEIWTAAGSGYANKPRPAVIVQDDRFDATDSVAVCLITSERHDAPLLRIALEPTEGNGLEQASSVMLDKIVTLRRTMLRRRIGRLTDDDMVRINRGLMVFLGLAG